MRFLSWLVFGTVALGVPVFAACSGGEIDPHYGPPGGLRNAKFPDPTATMTTSAPPPGDGGPPPAADGGDSGPINTACAKKWSTDIYPMMQTAGVWKCTNNACHTAGSKPDIDANNATTAYNQLVAYKLIANPVGQQYIIPGNIDATKHAFHCNLKGTCGAAPMPQGTTAAAGDIATLDIWLACGAPNN